MNIFLKKNIRMLLFSNSAFGMHVENNVAGMYRCFREMCSADLRLRINMFKNPCVDLQQYLDIPLFEGEDVCFDPSFESMETAMQFFTPRNDYDIRCLARTINPETFPCHDLPEVAFLGRSNAGKSSLMKAIFDNLSELRIQTSTKPGQTKSLRFYAAGNNFCLVDMPGYGYRQPKWFDISVVPYLKTRKNLVKTFLLIDSAENYHAWDDAFLQMLVDLKIPFAVILTKIDSVSDSHRLKTFLHVRKILKDFQINTCFPQIFMLSSITFEGLAYFQAFICHITGNLSQKSNVKCL